ncbi:sensor histidine kinase [Halopseudomonas laoshanensis]|uniref:histidine kinase n=1 Tax=Halopseudomonas laoshanensis TaxID=2268758 RepID=A0A7V7GUV8_9GAMM|nr:sensor histidine kinase [Halopseudomonas laoshanensis]KAA0695079.1 sensor histidine kinase [Halopseudomonas laoshanensis]
MKRRLFWTFCAVIGLGTVLLFWGISRLAWQTEEAMSFIDSNHQQTLRHYAAQAEALYLSGDEQALARWMQTLQQQEGTWAAVVRANVEPLGGTQLSQRFQQGFGLGRDLSWKIHLYFEENPIMDIPFTDDSVRFLIQLPQRMRPGTYWYSSRVLLQLVLPLILLLLVCALLYRHLMQPLRRLEQATRQFSEGHYDVRVRALLGSRKDELASLAETFDAMAERTGQLILSQRQRLADMSHELRTPLTRIDMAVSLAEQEAGTSPALLERIRTDCGGMRQLVEDALTLAWLENESPRLRDESLDLTDLLDSIIEDARFEYPEHHIEMRLPTAARLANSSHRALGQAIENVVRNALAYTPKGGCVRVVLESSVTRYTLVISDQGPGVPDQWLTQIFEPFFRIPGQIQDDPHGYGLGLALAMRQINAAGGSMLALNLPEGGLAVEIQLPKT